MQMATGANGTKFEAEPCIWGTHFLVYDDPGYKSVTVNEEVMKEHEELKQEVKRMIVKIQTTPITSKTMMPLKEKLKFIDTVQRLGISFYFEKEISNILQRVHLFDDYSSSNDLYTVSTAFRLLRYEGIYTPAAGIFEKFLDQISQSSSSKDIDVDGLLALYEASFYAIPEEDILDRAQDLTASELKSILPSLQKSNQLTQIEKIEHVLYRSIGRNCERLVARFYISVYKREPIFGKSLLKFAVHDYNIRQVGFQKDLASITKWCEESQAKKEVSFARQRIIEYYYCGVCVCPDPQYDFARKMIAKLLFMMTLIDDTYDTYGTIDELEIFTEAFAKLDPNTYPELPAYMKAIISTLKDVYAEVELHNLKRPYVVDYLKREFERLVRAYLEDARWIHTQRVPTYKEYFDVAMISIGRTAIPAMYFSGMGEVVSQEVLSWAFDDPVPKYIEFSTIAMRFLDDLSPSTGEVGQLQSALRVYMNHYGLSEEEARKKLREEISNSYKETNKGLLRGQTDTLGVPRAILKVIYAQGQANDICNRDHDCYSFPKRLKEDISLVFVEPVVI